MSAAATEVSAALITVPVPREARRRRVARRPHLVAVEAPPPALVHSCGHLVASSHVAVTGIWEAKPCARRSRTLLGIWFNSPGGKTAAEQDFRGRRSDTNHIPNTKPRDLQAAGSPQLRRIVADHAVAAGRAAGDGTAGLPGPDRAPHGGSDVRICGSQVIRE